MKIATVAGLIAGLAIVALVARKAYKDTARTASSDERYTIEELLADQEI